MRNIHENQATSLLGIPSSLPELNLKDNEAWKSVIKKFESLEKEIANRLVNETDKLISRVSLSMTLFWNVY